MDTVNSIALWLTIEDFGTKFHHGFIRKDFYEENMKLKKELARNKEELEYLGRFTIRAIRRHSRSGARNCAMSKGAKAPIHGLKRIKVVEDKLLRCEVRD